ncbi:hypothetical protein [Paraglaciecola sp. 25GB23A]|uniref:hypothetical protein n=1 Tax=Paraglaciecola sp. 25GB23A TaxID=3156068 RepID=UPI0032AFFEF9
MPDKKTGVVTRSSSSRISKTSKIKVVLSKPDAAKPATVVPATKPVKVKVSRSSKASTNSANQPTKTDKVVAGTTEKTAVSAASDNSLAASIVDIRYLLSRFAGNTQSIFKLQARRPDDLLLFELLGSNLKIAPSGSPRLVRIVSNKPSGIIIKLPAQHFGEQAFLDATGPEVVAGQEDVDFPESSEVKKNHATSNAETYGNLPASKIRMAGPSRLAFLMPTNVSSLPLTYDAVLEACQNWPPRLSPLAVPVPDDFTFGTVQDSSVMDVIQSEGWQTTLNLTEQAFSSVISPTATTALKNAATSIAKQLSTNYTGGLTSRSRVQIQNLFKTELSSLQRRFTALKQAENSDLAKALLAMHSTEIVVQAKPELAALLVEIVTGMFAIMQPHAPHWANTAIELPYRLIISPLENSRWRHLTQPSVHHQHTELWHTRLTRKINLGKNKASPIRAIWSPDYKLPDILAAANNNPPLPFRMSLDGIDREMLVKLMAGFTEKQASDKANPPDYKPTPSSAERLILSSMGGLLDAEGNWDYRTLPAAVGLEQWRYLTSLGRDQYVRVVYRGYLYPFGHSASLIKVTERKFESYQNDLNKRVAVLRQRFFIVVRESVREFNGHGHTFKGRNFPFTAIHIKTRTTPNLRAPEQSAAVPGPYPLEKLFTDPENPVPKRACFWPMLSANSDFEFDCRGVDLAGRMSSFSMPLLFVGLEANQLKPDHVRSAYNNTTENRRNTDFSGSAICYAPLSSKPEVQGDPRLPTTIMVFRAASNAAATIIEPHVYPEMVKADIGIRSVQRILNDPSATLTVKYPQIYKEHGFPTADNGPNSGELFLEALTPFSMLFSEGKKKTDALGAIASPSMEIGGLSRIIGTAADVQKVANQAFDPLAFFKDAKILGGISIADLLDPICALVDAPKMLSKELPDKLQANFDWQMTIKKSDPAGIFVHTPKEGSATLFSMQATVTAPINQANATSTDVLASIEHFKINLFGFITIWFDRLQFAAKSGSKPDVMVELHPLSEHEAPVEFGGPLEFINQLSDIIPMDGFSDPPNIEVSPSGISASYSLAIPNVQVGIFALTNLSIGAGFSLPFNNEPMQVRFNFSERENPFSLTVSLFGGGGFFALGIGSEGVNEIEAALEFGAAIQIDLGVASGGIEVKGGVYFHWLQESVELSGYVRLHGELSILGLISASLTFNLSLSYLKDNGGSIVWGEASLIIEVDVLLFSGSVEVHCRREFAGSESDPTFLDLMPEANNWTDYCAAFAIEEAA